MTILESFAEFSANTRLDQLSKIEQNILGRHLLDTMGAAIAGRRTPIGQALRELAVPGKGSVTVCRPGTIDDITVRTGTVRHTEVDDIHTSSNVTPSSIIVATALTMSARLGVTDPQIVGGALTAGYEAILRLGMVIDGPVVMYKGRWPTFFCAAFGAAAVTARLLELSPETTAHALAVALTTCTGGAGRPGPSRPGRWLVVGEAARAGVASALAADRGFTAELALLDGNWMSQVHGFDGKPDAMVSGLGDDSIIADISIKPCCTGKQVTAALYSFRDLLADGLDPEQATAIEVFVPQRYAAMIDRPVVPNVHVSSFGSTRYQFGLAAYHPQSLFDSARTSRVTDARLDTLMDKITIAVDEALEVHMPRCWPARVEVTTTTGKVDQTVIAAPGDPDRRFDTEAVREKFHAVTDRLIGKEEADDWIACANGALTDCAGLEGLIGKFEDLFA
jgi:2-methylcitrate dehydratase PrpD